VVSAQPVNSPIHTHFAGDPPRAREENHAMDTTLDSQDGNGLEEFLQELVLHIERPEEVDTLRGILKDIKDPGVQTTQACDWLECRANADSSRYEIFRLCPNRIVRIGFVRGAENAKKVIPHLNALGNGLYFLHQSSSG
jgi:hypothetical protein